GRRAPGGLRHGQGPDQGRVRAPVYALLHHQAARHGTGARHRAVGGERPWRQDLRRERARARHDVPDRITNYELTKGNYELRIKNYELRTGIVYGIAAIRNS